MTEEQFIRSYDEHADAIFRFCYFKTSHREQSKDILQDTFMRAWEFIKQGGTVTNARAFLYKIANNLIIDWRRKKKSSSLDAMMDAGFDAAGDEHERIPEIADSRRVIAAIGSLDEKYRDALLLRYVDDLSVKEIADILGETETAVGVHLHRGKEKLKLLHQGTK